MFSAIKKLSAELLDRLRRHQLIALSKTNLAVLNKALNFIKDEANWFNQISIRFNKVGKALQQALKPNNKNSDATFFSKEMVYLNTLKQHQTVHNKLCHQLNNPAWWSECMKVAHVDDISKVAELAKAWQLQGRYAYYSTADLLVLYKNALAALKEWVIFAKTELTHNTQKVPQELAELYQTLLDQFEDEISHEKQAIRHSLLTRLNSGHRVGELRFDDIAHATTLQLQAIGALPTTIKPKTRGIHKTITPRDLKHIRNLFHQDGSTAEKTVLSKLLLHAKHEEILVERINAKGAVFGVPNVMRQYIVDKPPFYTKLPHWLHPLFTDSKLCYELLQTDQCQYLLLNHVSISNLSVDVPATLPQLLTSASWQSLTYSLRLLNQEETRLNKTTENLFALFHPKSHALVSAYKNHLQVMGKAFVYKQTQLLFNLMSTLEARLDKMPLTADEMKQLQKLCDQHLKNCDHYPSFSYEETNLRMRFSLLLSPKPQVLVGKDTFDSALQITTKLTVGENVTDRDLSTLKHANDALPIQTLHYNEAQIDFVLNQRFAKSKLAQCFMEELQINPLSLNANALIAHLNKIKQWANSIQAEENRLMPSSVFQKEIYCYGFRLLQTISEFKKATEYKKATGAIHFIVTTLKKIHQEDEVFNSFLNRLLAFEQTYQLYEWNVFSEIYVKTLIKHLSDSHPLLEDNASINLSPKATHRCRADKTEHEPYTQPISALTV